MSSWSIALFVLGALAVGLGAWLQRHRPAPLPVKTPLPLKTAATEPDRFGPYIVHGKLGVGGRRHQRPKSPR